MKRTVFFTLSLVLAAAALAFAGGSKEASQATSSAAVPTSLGTGPIVLNAYFETGFDIPFKLAEEFTKQYPNVTWNIKQDQFTNLINETPRLLSGDNPPDLIRLPTMVSFAKQGLLKNLDGYAKAFGWDKWPVPQLNQNRVAADGTRGSGSLYAMGLNYSLTGVFYNKQLAAQIGMTQPPKTLAEFEDLLAKAKAAGLQPIMEWGSAKSGMGLAFPLQNLMASVGPVGPINDWIFQKKGATIDTPDNLKAAQHLEQWRSEEHTSELQSP
jgi:raffinose/stachyose/melibiose transport system substrate-binding protein